MPMNPRLLRPLATEPNWRIVGPNVYSLYSRSIARTNATATVADVLTTPSGTYPGSNAFIGGVLLPDGRVYCVPFNSTSSRLYGGGQSYNINVLLSAYLNKF